MRSKLEKWERILEPIREAFRQYKNDVLELGEKIYKNLDNEERHVLVCYIINILYEHAKEGGTYRYLLYDRLGLDDYGLLQKCGLLEIHNLISGELKENDNEI